ncbi:Hypothetical protein NTJ_08441 [Nesidiocoris tenuis]|uniref:Uncharacterized protein n=1 Tax=Nesidiocoris tenuis TaxID=355587 RepID=A0ABN7AYP1_9HEMI|nr:Hypothetical protein NTJ_08441 [Nesidiocoris tenuis]
MAYPTENDTIYLLNWLEKMREKLRSKLEKEIQKNDELANQIYENRREFDTTQLEIERIRKFKENVHDSREQIRKLVLHEKTLSDSMETTEKEKSRTMSKISSLGKALKNLEALGKMIQPNSNKC